MQVSGSDIYYLFIFGGCVGSQLPYAGSFVVLCGLLSSCDVQGFFISSLVAAHRLQGAWALVCGTWAPVEMQELSSCGAQLSCTAACGILVPRPGIKPASSAL